MRRVAAGELEGARELAVPADVWPMLQPRLAKLGADHRVTCAIQSGTLVLSGPEKYVGDALKACKLFVRQHARTTASVTLTREDDVAFMSTTMATVHAWLAEPWAEDGEPASIAVIADEVRVDNLREEAVHSAEEAMRVLYRGTEHRTVGETQMNGRSSRSHAKRRPHTPHGAISTGAPRASASAPVGAAVAVPPRAAAPSSAPPAAPGRGRPAAGPLTARARSAHRRPAVRGRSADGPWTVCGRP